MTAASPCCKDGPDQAGAVCTRWRRAAGGRRSAGVLPTSWVCPSLCTAGTCCMQSGCIESQPTRCTTVKGDRGRWSGWCLQVHFRNRGSHAANRRRWDGTVLAVPRPSWCDAQDAADAERLDFQAWVDHAPTARGSVTTGSAASHQRAAASAAQQARPSAERTPVVSLVDGSWL